MIGTLTMLGGSLAYYLPAIPFIFWMFGVLGWMILIVESLIAAPLWAVSHAVPEGEGFAGRYAMQGWQLFINVVFRPILLTLGLLMSMFMLHYITKLAIYGYAITNFSIVTSTSYSSILAFVFGNIVLVGLVITLAHKSHEMIYETADNVMKWLGFGVHGLGESKGESMVQGGFKGGTHAVGAAAGAMLSKGAGEPKAPPPGGGGGETPANTHPNAVAGEAVNEGRKVVGKDEGNKT